MDFFDIDPKGLLPLIHWLRHRPGTPAREPREAPAPAPQRRAGCC